MAVGAILHVGCRKHGEGRFNGPVYGNGTFRYVPIPEKEERATERSWTYADLRLEETLPQPWRFGKYAHYDPEFSDYTYGEPDTSKHRLRLKIARQLRKDDILFFISTLEHKPKETVRREEDVVPDWAYYLIGFFELAEPPTEAPNPIPFDIRDRFSNNAHVRGSETEPLLLFRGTRTGRNRSRQLSLANAISYRQIPNELARRVMPWLRPRANMLAEGWNYRWWGEDLVSEQGVDLLLRAVGIGS